MVKIVFIAYRRPDLTSEQFQARWGGAHAALVKEIHAPVRMRGYVQSRTLDVPMNAEFARSRGMTLDALPDGIAEAWFDSIEDMQAGFSDAEGARVAARFMEDELEFVDHARSFAFMTEESTVIAVNEFDAQALAPAAEVRI